MIIIGAGMAGCLAAILNPNSRVLEASPTPPDNHRAVLRFRSKEVSNLTGIPFKEVTVRKAIWFEGEEWNATPRLSNLYAKKVAGRITDRSIWNLDTVQRYVAPPNFHMIMLEMLGERVEYGVKISGINAGYVHYDNHKQSIARMNQPLISTMPMEVLAGCVGAEHMLETEHFGFKEIYTVRGKVKGCDVHQTVYYPCPSTCIYRITLTGEDLIIESMGRSPRGVEISRAIDAFGLLFEDVKFEQEVGSQKYGKIASINDAVRRNFICQMTQQYNIYSLGRFGIWKNILLDDVAEDVHIIKKLATADNYEIWRKRV